MALGIIFVVNVLSAKCLGGCLLQVGARVGAGVGFLENPVNQQTYNQQYRNLLLQFVTKNIIP